MLYSGADLIRTSGQQQERINRLHAVESIAPVSATDSPSSHLDENTQGALLRFARFIHKEGEKKRGQPPQIETPTNAGVAKNPYVALAERERHSEELGQMLNVYV